MDRLKALVEVGSFGSIVRAAAGDPARQGKGLRLTAAGKELARISRFFLLGLSNFQRGCLAEGQSYRIGAGATFAAVFLLPLLAGAREERQGLRFRVETVGAKDVERRLHDLTLDFGVVTGAALSRPLQTKALGWWRLRLWVPRKLCRTALEAKRGWESRTLPLAWPLGELAPGEVGWEPGFEPELGCETFLEARTALSGKVLAALLPDFLEPEGDPEKYHVIEIPRAATPGFEYHLAWNPRLLRLNPHAARRRDALVKGLAAVMGARDLPGKN